MVCNDCQQLNIRFNRFGEDYSEITRVLVSKEVENIEKCTDLRVINPESGFESETVVESVTFKF